MTNPRKTSTLRVLSLTFSLLLHFTVSAPVPQSSVHEKLLQCLADQTKSPVGQLSKILFSQSTDTFGSVLSNYIRNARFNTTSVRKPTVIITPLEDTHVSAAVVCSKSLGFRLKIRSGGHDYEGLSYVSDTPFFVLDMFNYRDISFDLADQTAWIGAGTTIGELYYRISQKSSTLAFPAGACPTVGAGGHISGAGYGNLLRKFGLTVDHVIDAKLVDVSGRVLDRKSMGEDLFWAICGGGGASFGVILSFKIKLVPVPETVTFFRVEKSIEENATDMVYKWQFVAPKTDPNLFMRMLLQPITRNKQRTLRASVVAMFLGKSDEVVSLMQNEFPELGLKKETCLEGSWVQSTLWWANFLNYTTTSPEVLLDRNLNTANFLKRKSDYVQTEISKANLDALFKRMIEIGKTGLVFNPYGGKMSETSPSQTPFPHRNRLFKIQYSVNWQDAGEGISAGYLEQAKLLHTFMTPLVTKNPRNAYLNYRDIDIGVNHFGPDSYVEGEVYGRAFFGDNFDRLVKVKTAVDPDNFFRYEQSIPILTSKTLRNWWV